MVRLKHKVNPEKIREMRDERWPTCFIVTLVIT